MPINDVFLRLANRQTGATAQRHCVPRLQRRAGRSIAAAILLCLLAYTPSLAVDSSWLYGIHWYNDPASNDVEVMTGGKGIWDLEIVLTEDTGMWGLASQLSKFQTIVDRGHTLIIRIHPRWSLVVPGPNTPETSIADRMETFLPKLIDAADQLSDLAHIWQIGNEMNLGFEYDIGNLTPELYVDKYVEIRNAIHSVSSSLGPQIVLLGPVAPVDNAYLGAMCDALIAGGYTIDGFAVHAYGGSRGNFLTDIASQTALIDSKGFADKPIYITEWGAPVDPISDTNEAGVAQFLHSSFVNLANYNANPANHPIICACWFIYKIDAYWQTWSILGLHGLHPPGPDNDLYDAFQYACTLDLPAGEGGPLPDGPWISRTPSVLSPVVTEGQNAPDQTFEISNTGTGTLSYEITDDVPWLWVTPADGDSAGEPDLITVHYDTAGLPFGTYTANITLAAEGAQNSPTGVTINLTVQSTAIPPDIDNPGFEDDGGFFNVATGWTGFGGSKWERVYDSEHPVVQGVSEIAVGGSCGVYQTISTTPGLIYRVSALARTQISDYQASIGVDPGGGHDEGSATFGPACTANAWTPIMTEFTATSPLATILLRAHHAGTFYQTGKWCVFDDVSIEIIGVNNQPPTAVAHADRLSGTAPLAVLFDGSGSSDPDPGDALSYSWDFDDGSSPASGVTTSHTFADSGEYVVSLTVCDGRGGSDTDTLRITVDEGLLLSPADFDLDGDVDLEDFGHFQRCLTGPGVHQDDPACENARFDIDYDVDQDDFAMFQGCLTRANVPADPDCMDN